MSFPSKGPRNLGRSLRALGRVSMFSKHGKESSEMMTGSKSGGRFEVFQAAQGMWRFRLLDPAGDEVAYNEIFPDAKSAKAACENIIEAASGAKIDIMDG